MSSENKTTESSNIVTLTATCNYQMDKSTGQILSINLVPTTAVAPQFKEKVKNVELVMYARTDKLEKVKELLAQNCDVDVVDASGDTPLHEASRHGHKEIVEILLQHGADINKENNNVGSTPLFLAALFNRKEIVEILFQHGADPNKENNDKNTPLHMVTRSGRKEIIEILLQHGADINKENNDKNTPLHCAVIRENTEIIEILLQHGADFTIKNKYNKTALDIAKELNKYIIIKTLKNHIKKVTEKSTPQKPVAQITQVETPRQPTKTDVFEIDFVYKGEKFAYKGPESQFETYLKFVKSGF